MAEPELFDINGQTFASIDVNIGGKKLMVDNGAGFLADTLSSKSKVQAMVENLKHGGTTYTDFKHCHEAYGRDLKRQLMADLLLKREEIIAFESALGVLDVAANCVATIDAMMTAERVIPSMLNPSKVQNIVSTTTEDIRTLSPQKAGKLFGITTQADVEDLREDVKSEILKVLKETGFLNEPVTREYLTTLKTSNVLGPGFTVDPTYFTDAKWTDKHKGVLLGLVLRVYNCSGVVGYVPQETKPKRAIDQVLGTVAETMKNFKRG